MKTVFLFVPHYVFGSDLLHTQYIKYLSQKYKIIVFSPIVKEDSPHDYWQSPNIIYKFWDTPRPKFWIFFNKTLRIAMVREFDGLEYHKLRAITGKNLNWRRKILGIISRLLPKLLTNADTFSFIEKLLIPNSDDFKKLLGEYKPEIILTSTPGFSDTEAEIIHLSKKNNMPTMAVNFNWDNLFNNAKHIRKTDFLVTWNEVAKKAAKDIHHYKSDRVFVGGPLRFDHHFAHGQIKRDETERENFLDRKSLDPKLKTVLFTTVPPHTYPFQVEFLKELIELRDKNIFGEDLNIYVRTHPRDEVGNYKKFSGIRNLHIEHAGTIKDKQRGQLNRTEMDEDDLNNLRQTLLYSDVAINFRSTITLETFIYDIPTINLAYNGYSLYYQMDHYIPIIKEAAVKLVTDTDSFVSAMKKYLNNSSLDREKRRKILDQEIPYRDGLSYKRNVDFIETALQNLNK